MARQTDSSSKGASKNPLRHLRASDLRGAVQLAAKATVGVAHVTEGVHQAVLGGMGLPGGAPGKARGLTGFIYKTVRGVTHVVGKGVDLALEKITGLIDTAGAASSAQREAVLAALNGVLGDQMAEAGNPLATSMSLRLNGEVIAPRLLKSTAVSGKVLLLVHGLCMNDLQWNRQGHDHGAQLADTLGYTPVYVRYNTGRHVSVNGLELATQLEQLIARWPQPVEELSILVHSMGGLVTRSACELANMAGHQWPRTLKNIVFLGTPHHGAPLERAGNWVDVLLGSTPYSRPFGKLAQIRSAGITDLRYGLLREEDWAGKDRFRRTPDARMPLPLPEGVNCFTVAATLAGKSSLLAERLLGDGLVPLNSALGKHAEPAHTLGFSKDAQLTVYRTSHMALLGSPQAAAQVQRWLAR